MNLDFLKTGMILGLFFVILLIGVSTTPIASAEVTVNWSVGGASPITSMGITEGNLDSGHPVSIKVTDTDSVFNPAAIDSIDVLITSNLEPSGTLLKLTETGVNTNQFYGDTASHDGNFVFIPNPGYRFSISDTVIVQVYENPATGCDTDDTITELDSVNAFEGVFVYSETEVDNFNFGIGLILTETGPNTCIFEGNLQFTDSGSSDDSTGTLLVSEGDVLTFFDDVTHNVVNAQIIPNMDGKGSIAVDYDNLLVNNEVMATYLGVSAPLDLHDDRKPGRGGGGPIGPIAVVDKGDSGSDSSKGSSCSGDCTPPTLGVDSSLKRIVEGGFSFNDNPVDVDLFYTHYPLVTVQVGEQNRAILKIYDDGGTQNIEHVELGFGLGKDESFSENRAAIILDISRDGRQSVTTFDPENVLDDVSVVTKKDRCSNLVSSQCLVVIMDHTFREPLEFNMVGTQVWDSKKNSWQNFYNHGVHILGESLNPPKTKQVAFGTKDMRGLYTLTQINKIQDKWIDEFGNVYQHQGNDRFDKIDTIPKQVIEDFITMHGCDRNCNWFEKYKQNQEEIAKSKIEQILGGDITKDLPQFIPGPQISMVSRANDVKLQNSINFEAQKAQEIFIDEYYTKYNLPLYINPENSNQFMAFENLDGIMNNNK